MGCPPEAPRRVTVLGMARSGVAAAELALLQGHTVLTTDQKADAQVVPGAEAVHGRHRESDFTGAELVVVSPGVPPSVAPLQAARAAGVPVVGELGFAFEVIDEHDVPVLAVTGTNGKSSTVWFINALLRAAGITTWVGGNLGEPLSRLALSLLKGEQRPQVAIVEVSSYQLELAGRFRPAAAAVLNLRPDHLARHGTMAEYGRTKLRIFENMREDGVCVVPLHEPLLPIEGLPGTVLHHDGWPGARHIGAVLYLQGTGDDGAIDLGDFRLPGRHNVENLAAAALLVQALGVGRDHLRLDAVQSLPHRMERVAEDGGVVWLNDSKATNIDAALTGIRGAGAPQVALLGGQGKNGADYTALAPALRSRARRVICFGASGPAIAAALRIPLAPAVAVSVVPDLAAAVEEARSHAIPGDTVLLSPACASFDEFRDFEHRGAVFTALARRLPPASLPGDTP